MDQFKGIRFCQICRNITTAKINEENDLYFYCQTCERVEKVGKKDQQNPEKCLIYRNEIKRSGQRDIIDPYLAIDPTMSRTELPKDKCCKKCGHNVAVFFRSQDDQDKRLVLAYICAKVDKYGIPCGNY